MEQDFRSTQHTVMGLSASMAGFKMRKAFNLIEMPAVGKRGFTLIELLVVVSIIALLIGILLPVLSSVQYGVRTTVCATQLKQMGIAATSYAVDNQDYYPHKMDTGTTAVYNAIDQAYYRPEQNITTIREQGTSKYNYIPLLDPYVSNTDEMFICPHTDSLWDDGYGGSTNSQIISYAMYWGISGGVSNPADSNVAVHVRVPQARLGEGFGPGRWLKQNGRFDNSSRYRILASDYVAWARIRPKTYGNHPPTGGEYEELGTANASPLAYQYDETIHGNANYLYDDGSVELYGNIYLDNIGRQPDSEFGFMDGRWLAPTDRVDP